MFYVVKWQLYLLSKCLGETHGHVVLGALVSLHVTLAGEVFVTHFTLVHRLAPRDAPVTLLIQSQLHIATLNLG